MTRAKLAVLISGRGTNLQSLIEAAKDPEYPAEIGLVISNRPDAKGLEKAKAENIPQYIIDHKDFQTREDFDAALDFALDHLDHRGVTIHAFLREHTHLRHIHKGIRINEITCQSRTSCNAAADRHAGVKS